MEQFHQQLATRRRFFGQSALGLGTAALATLLDTDATLARRLVAPTGGLPHLPDVAPRAKRAIYLFMAGAPSQLDLLDYKPRMRDYFDVDLPDSVRMGQRLTTMTSGQDRFPIVPSIYKFQRHGQSGAWFSELLPHIASIADDICIIKTMHTEAINHDPAITYICTGDQLPGKPSLGAWLSYGLGSENQDLPAFVVLTSTWSARREASTSPS